MKGFTRMETRFSLCGLNSDLVSIISERAVSTLLQFNTDVKKNCSVFSGLEI